MAAASGTCLGACLMCLLAGLSGRADAAVGSLAREATEALLRQGARLDVPVGGLSRPTWQAELDDVARRGVRLFEQAGRSSRLATAGPEHGPLLARFVGRHGRPAFAVVDDPHRCALLFRHGETAGRAMLRHPGLAEDLVGLGGREAAEVLSHCDAGQARRLWELARAGVIDAAATRQGIWQVLRSHGGRAVAYCWRHRRLLVVGSVMLAFLADPEAFLDGSRELVLDPLREHGLLAPALFGLALLLAGPWLLTAVWWCLRSGLRRGRVLLRLRA